MPEQQRVLLKVVTLPAGVKDVDELLRRPGSSVGVLEDLRRVAANELERHWQLPTCSRCRRHVPWFRLSRNGVGSSVCLDCTAAARALRKYWQQIGAAA